MEGSATVTDPKPVIAIPNAGDDVARARFAHALGREAKRWNVSDARRWAAELSRVARSRDDAESPFFTALQLVARGFADTLEDAQEQADLARTRNASAKYRLLQHLHLHGPSRPARLAEALDIDTSYASRLVKSTLKAGLITRGDHAQSLDGRAVEYELTEAGFALLERARRAGAVSVEISPEAIAQNRIDLLRHELVVRQEARRSGHVDVAALRDELTRLGDEANKLGAEDLAVDVFGELATVLRHHHHLDDAREIVDEHLSATGAITDRALIRRNYELARLEMLTPRPNLARAEKLIDECRPALEGAHISGLWIDLAASECERLGGRVVEAFSSAESAFLTAEADDNAFAMLKAGIQVLLICRTSDLRAGRYDARLAERLHSWAAKEGYSILAGEAGLHLGEIRRSNGRRDEAFAALEGAVEDLTSGAAGRAGAFAASALAACMFDSALAAVVPRGAGTGARRPPLAKLSGWAKTKHVQNARARLQDAIALASTAQAADAEALSLRRLGILELSQGKADVAEGHFVKALKIYGSSNRQSAIGRLECQVGVAAATGSPEHVQAGLHALIEVRERAGEVVGKSLVPMSLVDKWVIDELAAVTREVRPSDLGLIDSEVKTLAKLNLYRSSSTRGRSLMGKEPPLF